MTECVPGFNLSEEPTTAPARGTASENALNAHPTAPVTLRGVSIPLASDVGQVFLTDCAYNRARLVSDEQICEKFGITPEAWADIIKNPAVRLAVNGEHERLIRTGDIARQSAAQLFATAPEVLGRILNDPKSSPRHVIEASKELRATACVGTDQTGEDVDRVVVTINLGNAPEDKLVFDTGPFKRTTQENVDAE